MPASRHWMPRRHSHRAIDGSKGTDERQPCWIQSWRGIALTERSRCITTWKLMPALRLVTWARSAGELRSACAVFEARRRGRRRSRINRRAGGLLGSQLCSNWWQKPTDNMAPFLFARKKEQSRSCWSPRDAQSVGSYPRAGSRILREKRHESRRTKNRV